VAIEDDPSGDYMSLRAVFGMDYNHGGKQTMTDEITPEVFNHLVDLAALELEPAEAEYLRGQLNNQLKAIHELAAIPLDDSVPVASHGVPYTPESSPPARPDQWQPEPEPARLLSGAPETEDGYLVVPDIPHEELS
jgi:aspartyl/glutamyl-tRNA(Asn/Gln) amidotransferase C subunit